MLQQETRCEVADNSGAKIAYVIRVYGGSTASGKFTRRTAGVGTSIDYLTAKNNLEQARINMIIAKYDYLLRCKVLDYYQGRVSW